MAKYNHFMIDIETLDRASTSIVLSIAIIPFNFDEADKVKIEELRSRALFVKFDRNEQLKKYKRTYTQDTIDWFKDQPEVVRDISYNPSEIDMNLVDGWDKVLKFIESNRSSKNCHYWSRGCFEQHILSNLVEFSLKQNHKQIDGGQFNNWDEVRTALRILYGDDYDPVISWNGKGLLNCTYPNWEEEAKKLKKHNPVDDCIIDIIYLLYGKSK